MGLFDIFKNLFSKSGKDAARKKKKAVSRKKTAKKRTGKKGKNASAQKADKQTGSTKKKANAKQTKAEAPLKKKKMDADKAKSGVKKTPEKKTASKKKNTKKAKPTKLPFSFGGKSNKRKKSEQVKADPIDKTALGFSISLKGDDEHARKRNALRIKVKGLVVHIPRLNNKFPVTDISATGLGFAFEKPRMKAGVKLKMDIYLQGECKATGVECKVMRHAGKSVGCIFVELDRSQDDAVHEIVLIGQKQQAARKNAQKDRNFVLPS